MQYFECIGGVENNQNVSIDETPFYDDLVYCIIILI